MKRPDWFKTYVDSLNDIKFKKLKNNGSVFSHYVLLWELLKNESAKSGGVIDCDPDDWAILFDMLTEQLSEPEVNDMIYEMEDVKLIEITEGQIKIKNWEKYQAEALSTGRVREHRKNKEVEELVTKILLRFNEITGKRYSVKTEGSRELIRGRLNEGRTEAELIAVSQDRFKKWQNDPKMSKYIRPSTVFRPGNFDNYLNEIPNDQLQAVNDGTMLKVRNMYEVVKYISRDEYEKAADGFYTILDE